MVYSVGILGAGPGVAALHLPTLSYLRDRFRVVAICDGGSGRAQVLADEHGLTRWGSESELLADPQVDTVLICSPPEAHARQIRAAALAGKRAIFCEKPLATTVADAREAIDACRAAGTALIVGTNHLFDPGWVQARQHLGDVDAPIQSISVTVSLPPNDRYHRLVADGGPFTAPSRGRPDLTDPAVAAQVVRQLISGLAVHDLPALRALAPAFERLVYARVIEPVGYAIGYLASGVLVQLTAVMVAEGADALWRVTIGSDRGHLDVAFPPSFVHAGAAAVSARTSGGRRLDFARDAVLDGYQAEWMSLADQLDAGAATLYDGLLADAVYAITIADAAADHIAAGGSAVSGDEAQRVVGGVTGASQPERTRLRPDVAADAIASRGGVAARVVVVECAGALSEREGLLQDAIGWGRTLVGSDLVLRSSHTTDGATLALFESADRIAVTVCFTLQGSGVTGGFIRATALGETRTEVLVDEAAGVVRVETTTGDGCLRLPSRYEDAQRASRDIRSPEKTITDLL